MVCARIGGRANPRECGHFFSFEEDNSPTLGPKFSVKFPSLLEAFLDDFLIIFQNGGQKRERYRCQIPSLVEHFEDKFQPFWFHWRSRMRSLMVTMVKSSDSELPVLDFSRAHHFRRACAVRKLGIWEWDCLFSVIGWYFYFCRVIVSVIYNIPV